MAEDHQAWVKEEVYWAVWRAFVMTLETLEILAVDGTGGVGERAIAAIVAREARGMIPEYRPNTVSNALPPVRSAAGA